jgi:hypothetical protein
MWSDAARKVFYALTAGLVILSLRSILQSLGKNAPDKEEKR